MKLQRRIIVVGHLILAIVLLFVALLAVVSVIRQLKYKNLFALAFSALTALAFGFFSIATIISEIAG
ncbi:DUF2759 family protein [Oceanobacillus profundus]|uniref:DUF2759 family protein n=1 Tax=Oceanobacillus profundus TaxID=372463 RepID=A0A417YGA5_9BACI|nr:DUF2759 family protein [Oceanobacillus profundus]MBR3118747.1 DUF2759 family protein [Oceanobacillus sp.]PAE31210.1 DUF2759 domain-containing protein [Paenibacillus sp. 7884-2]MCM3396759.1 DUF2759 domain-containing protein [Oceanobacillus profundus]MDO6448059.1 DUF2759 family protein [Oceanobacillus profundus]RHW31717.1 DUF2759 family protein [Oceanobacillus profundus]